MTDEHLVREAWKTVYHRDTAYSLPAGPHYVIIDNWRKRVFTAYRHTESEAWSAARAFTEKRIEEIGQLQEEIKLIRWVEQENHLDNEGAICERILARLESALADLQRGMKVRP